MKKIFKLFQEKNSNVVGIEYSSELQKNYFQFVESQYKKGLRCTDPKKLDKLI